jgi:hypothetical protein
VGRLGESSGMARQIRRPELYARSTDDYGSDVSAKQPHGPSEEPGEPGERLRGYQIVISRSAAVGGILVIALLIALALGIGVVIGTYIR